MNEPSEKSSTVVSIAFVTLCIAMSVAYFLMPGRLEWFTQVAQWFRAMLGL